MPGVGPQGLIQLLLDLGQIMMSACSNHGSLEVVKARLRSSQESMEFGLRLSSQVKGADSNATEKYSALMELDPLRP
jgi:hypothetical protein